MTDLRFLRQSSAVNMERLRALQVSIIGMGSVGSYTALSASKIGVGKLDIWDADTVGPENIACQIYGDQHIGEFKVKAAADLICMLGSSNITTHQEMFTDAPLSEVTFSCTDSMKARAAIWKSARHQPQIALFVDIRIGLEVMVMYLVRQGIREDRIRYSQSLHTDSEALDLPCSARGIIHASLISSAVAANVLKRFVNDEPLPTRIILDFTTFTMMT